MRALRLLCWLTIFAVPLVADSRQTSGAGRNQRGFPVADDLSTIVRNLSDKAQDLWNAARQQRGSDPANLHMNIGAFAGIALAMSDKVGDAREDVALRAGAHRLVDLAGDIDADVTRGNLSNAWRSVQEHLVRLSDSYSLGYNAPGLGRGPWRQGQQQRGGLFRWRGRVDGSDQINLRGDRVWVQHLQFNPIRDASYDLAQPFPARNTALRLAKLRGRGRVEILTQPSNRNGYTVIIQVDDPDPGDDFYEFELTW